MSPSFKKKFTPKSISTNLFMVLLMNSHSVIATDEPENPIPAPINNRLAVKGLAFIQR